MKKNGMAMENNNSHHVAWKDRLGLNKLWMNDIFACSEAYGSPEYISRVDRLRNDIINIKDGPKLYDIIMTYWTQQMVQLGNELLDEWENENKQESKITEERDEALIRIRNFQAEKFCHYIIQVLENNGFGFYQSSFETEEKML